jgi:glycosyltransferase involved in cell wall biosynthesis
MSTELLDEDSESSGAPTVVAVIPLYNGAKYIELAVRSVLSQSVAVAEIVIVDDGSTDDGPAIVKRLAEVNPIRFIHKPNGGQASARNVGIAESKSSLIALLDQDDVWYPEHVETLIHPFLKTPHARLGWTYSDLDQVDEAGNMLVHNLLTAEAAFHPKRDLYSCLRTDMHILPSASLISRSAFESVGGFDERLCGYEDDDLFLRMFRRGYESVYFGEASTQFRSHSGSTSYSPRIAASRIAYFRKLVEEFPDDEFREVCFRRDLLAPRFLRLIVSDYSRNVRLGNRDAMRQNVEDLSELTPHLRVRQRFVFGMTAKPMKSYRLSRTIYALRLNKLHRVLRG